MSSRALKRLQGGSEKDLAAWKTGIIGEDEERSIDEDDQENALLKSVNLNPFDLLTQSPSESELKEDDNETEHASTTANINKNDSVFKKKKIRKRKKKIRHVGNHISSEDNELSDKPPSDINPFVGKASEAVNRKMQTHRIEIYRSLLNVELKHLNPHNEMRRTFGKRVVKIENKRGRQKLTLKTTYLVAPKESWPPIMRNIIIMKPTSSDTGTSSLAGNNGIKTQWFAFEHSEYYQNVQNMFLPALERTDSDFLVTLLRRCPYHVDSLIQLGELCKMTEDYALASDLLERALLVLESALHPSFSLTSGNCRLDYRRQENRSFFIVLYKQAQYLEGRACCRTAFEISKLLFNLNSEDPLAIVLVMDYYALRCKQYVWIVKFYEEYDSLRNLSQLPNMAYSYALALFCIHGQCDQADKALQYALLMFPGVLRPLLEELSVQTDQRVIASSYFNSDVSNNQSPALHQLVCLYVCRAKVVWRQHQYLSWLESNVNAVMDRIDSKDAIIEDYNLKRANRYGTPPRPILRHVILADFKDKVPLGSFLIKENSIVAYDPLPPLDSINFYDRKSSSSSPTTAASNHSVSMFFQSLMPSFNLNNRGARQNVAYAVEAANNGDIFEAVDGNEDVAQFNQQLLINANGNEGAAPIENPALREWTQPLNGIVDILRDFVHNFHIGDQSQQIVNDRNESSEEDTTDYS